MRRVLLAMLSTAAAYTPVPAIELSDHSPGAAPAITSTLTQPSGQSASKTISAQFPAAFTYNPDFAVAGCAAADEQAVTCPENTRLGTFDATSPFGTATGPVHLMADLRLVAFIESYFGLVRQRIVGKIFVGDQGGAKVVFEELPNIAVTSSTIALDGGTHGSLVNPRRCGTYEIRSRLVSHEDEVVEKTLPVKIEGCPAALAVRAPRYAGGMLRWRVSESVRTEVVVLQGGKGVWSEVLRRSVGGTSLRLRGLAPGRYRAVLRAIAADGRASPARTLSFRIG